MNEKAKLRTGHVGEGPSATPFDCAQDRLRTGNPSGEEPLASYRYLASILESMLDAVIVANPDGTIRTVNRAALDLLGYAEEEIIGQGVGTIFEEEEEEEEEGFFRGTGLARLVREEAAQDVELTLLAKSGERIPVVFNGSVIREEDGRLAAVVGVARDIRERKRVEQLLQALNQAALAMEHALTPGEIFAAVAEELKKLGLSCVVFLTDEGQSRLFAEYLSYEAGALKAAEKLARLKTDDLSILVEAADTSKEVVWERKTIFVENVEQTLRQVLPEPVKRFAGQITKILKIPKSIATPLVVEDKVSGVLVVQSDDLTENDVPAVTAFAHQMAAAWRKARLMQDLERSLTKRKRSEEALRGSEERFRQVAENAQEWIWEVDAHGLYTYASPIVEKILGYEPEEVVGKKHFYDLIYPEDREELKKAAFEVFAQKQGFREFINRNVRKDGETVWLSTSGVPILDEEGNLLGYRGADMDITERKRAEEALRIRDWAIESSINAIALADLEGNLTYVNPSFLKLWGYDDAKEVLERPAVEFWQMEEKAAEVVEALRDRGGWMGERVGMRKDGSLFDLELLASMVTDEAGKPIRMMASFVDITERKRAEEEIRQRTTQLEALRQVGLEITAELDLDALLHSIVSRAIELMGGTAGGLYFYRLDRDVLEWSVPVGPDLAPIGTVLHRGEGLAGKVWETGEPLIVDDYQHWEGRAAVWEGCPVMAVVGVPVRWGEEFLGVLSVHTDTPLAFSPADAELLCLFADQAAIAIENARLYESEHRRSVELETLRQASLRLTSTLELQPILEAILDHALKLVAADDAHIFLYDGERLAFGAALWADAHQQEPYSKPRLHGLTYTAARSGECIVVPDVNSHPLYRDYPWGGGAIVGLPLRIGERVVGVMNVAFERPHAFDENELRVLGLLADQAAIAIENARLYEAEQERRHIAETLRQTSTVLSSTLELDEVLGLILQQLRQVVPYDSASIQRRQGGVLSPLTEFIPSEAEGLRTGLSKGERLEIVACQGFEEADKVVGLVFSLEPKFPNYRVVTTKAPLAIEDIIQDYPHFKEEADSYESGRIRSWLGVPLMVKDQVIGMIALDRAEVRPYTAEESQLAMAFANQAAIAIENARLYGAAQRELAERKKAEDSIKRAAEEWRTTFDSITDLVSVCDKDFRLTRVNKAYADIAKKKPKELIGKLCYEIVHGTNEPTLNCPHKKTLETKKLATAEFFEPHLGMHLELSTSPIFDEKGEVVASAHLIRDITERKRAEDALRESEEELETIMQSVNDVILQLSPLGLIKYVSPNVEELYGYKPEDLIGKHLKKTTPLSEVPKALEALKSVLSGKVVENLEINQIDNSGNIVPMEVNITPVKKEGKIIAVQGVMRDITERKRAEEELRKYRDHLEELVEERTAELQQEITQRKRAEKEIRLLGERYQDLYNNAPIMYLSLDANGIIIECNNTILDRLGYTESELIGKAMSKFGTKESAAKAEKDFPRLLETGRIVGVERQLVTKSGEIIDVILDVAVEYDEHRKPIKTRATCADITERKRAQEALRERDRQLENQERRRLAQEVHDGLIQEITSITLQLELCEKLMAKNPERAMLQLEKAKNQARVSLQRARELVSDLRLAGLRKKAFVEALTEHVAGLEEEDLAVSLTVTGSVKTLAATAESHLSRIAQEALTNARRHGQAEHVEVSLDYGEEMLTLTIMDDGVGFPVQETLEKAQDEKQFGLLGMQERTHLLGGELNIESSPGRGTRLTVKVPL